MLLLLLLQAWKQEDSPVKNNLRMCLYSAETDDICIIDI